MTDITITREQRLAEQEAIIEAGLNTFLDVGRALLIVRDERLYEPTYPDFKTYLFERYEVSQKQLYEYMEVAAIADSISSDSPIGESETLSIDAYQALGDIEDKVERRAVLQLAKQVKVKPTAPIIRAAQTVIEDMKLTGGFVDVGDGKMTAATAAVIQSVADRKNRQLDHIRGNYKSEELLNKSCTLQQACEAMADLALRCGDQTMVKVLVYSSMPKSEVQS